MTQNNQQSKTQSKNDIKNAVMAKIRDVQSPVPIKNKNQEKISNQNNQNNNNVNKYLQNMGNPKQNSNFKNVFANENNSSVTPKPQIKVASNQIQLSKNKKRFDTLNSEQDDNSRNALQQVPSNYSNTGNFNQVNPSRAQLPRY